MDALRFDVDPQGTQTGSICLSAGALKLSAHVK